MKVEIIPPPSAPALAPGQLWEHKDGCIYLATRPKSDIVLVNTLGFNSRWADVGFNGDENKFTYVGTLQVTL